uniref:Uncharacterized protein n=1 Tax=Callorhinchus milii TaxID=7868 RepID=A0A4W3K032_CALMI
KHFKTKCVRVCEVISLMPPPHTYTHTHTPSLFLEIAAVLLEGQLCIKNTSWVSVLRLPPILRVINDWNRLLGGLWNGIPESGGRMAESLIAYGGAGDTRQASVR